RMVHSEFFIGVLIAVFLDRVIADEKSLFSNEDQILQLDVDNFNQKVYSQGRAFFVEFYSSWCGACIAYAPLYKKFALDVQAWKPIIEVGAVNCADDKNSRICREHAIDAFPTIKYFKYMSKGKEDGIRYEGNKHELATLPLDVAQLVRDDWLKQRPPQWPSFDYADNSSTVESLWQLAGPDATLLALIVEAYPARVTWAEKINFAKDKRVHIVLLSSGDALAKSLGATTAADLPKFYLYVKGQELPLFSSEAKITWPQIREKIAERLIAVGIERMAPSAVTAPPVVQQTEQTITASWNQFEVQLLDLTSAMYYILKEEIPRRQLIEGENMTALKLWIHMLKKYAPGTVPIRRLFYRIDEWLSQTSQVSAEQWIAKVDSVQSDLGYPLPTNMTWIACRGSKPYLRGYSCGLWTLLHTITVEAFRIEQNNPSFDAAVEVIEPIHQFIYRYFSCEACGKHFHNHVEKTDKSAIRRAADSIMWLWRTHNIVNKILAKSQSEDPAFPKQQFPPASICAPCHNNDGFVESEVLNFLIAYYSDIKTDSAEGGALKSAASKRFNPRFVVGVDKVDRLEQAEQRLRRENLDANPQRRWKHIDANDYVKPYDPSSGSHFFYLFWLSIMAAAIFITYMKYRRNRTKFWKTFYYYNDYKL
uniref:Sulfhydryl oxidase n=2 Tax=Parascaris univalens TaxID=6257 RepID=A0A914ZI59_PARUN